MILFFVFACAISVRKVSYKMLRAKYGYYPNFCFCSRNRLHQSTLSYTGSISEAVWNSLAQFNLTHSSFPTDRSLERDKYKEADPNYLDQFRTEVSNLGSGTSINNYWNPCYKEVGNFQSIGSKKGWKRGLRSHTAKIAIDGSLINTFDVDGLVAESLLNKTANLIELRKISPQLFVDKIRAIFLSGNRISNHHNFFQSKR